MAVGSCSSPAGPKEDKSVEITGRVVADGSQNPLRNVLVTMTQPRPERSVLSDSLGRFRFSVKVDSLISVTIRFNRESYDERTHTFLVAPVHRETGYEVSDIALTLKEGEEEDVDGTGTSGSVRLQGIDVSELAVVQTGGVEQARLTFVVTDSLGVGVGNQTVQFSLGATPGGGEAVFPLSAATNAAGVVTTTLTSGTASGVVQVIASVPRDGQSTLRSTPVAVVIRSGLPSANHFSLTPSKRNIPGYDRSGITLPITAFVGDRYGNPVRSGLPVYFTTNGGIITANSSTGANGQATTTLTSSLPRPTHAILGPGFATVTARTGGETAQTIEATAVVLFSGTTAIESATTTLSVPRGAAQTVNFTVSDQNGNPLAEGTTIKVSSDNPQLILSGQLDITLADLDQAGPGRTQFNFNAAYPADSSLAMPLTTVTVDVVSPNGNLKRTFTQPALAAGEGSAPPPGTTGTPTSIVLSTVSNSTIVVRESGGVEQSTLTFTVRDGSGKPVGSDAPVNVNFSLGANPGGGVALSPASATTDGQGRVSVTVQSGTASGVVQVVAQAADPALSAVRSTPASVTIRGGLPHLANFSVKTAKVNYRFNHSTATLQDIPVVAYLGDRYGNFVPSGTPVYFTTNGGNIGAEASSGPNGQASTVLTPVNPFPAGGTATITAQTVSWEGATISATRQILFSDNAQISNVTVNGAAGSTLSLTRGGSQTVAYRVSDQNGNPLVEGTTITVTADNDAMILSGNLSVTLPDTRTAGAGTTQFSFTASYPEGGTEAIAETKVTIAVLSPNGNVQHQLTQPAIAEGASGGTTGTPTSISLVSVTPNQIRVRDTGGVEQSVLTFQVRDANNNPLNEDNPIQVSFAAVVNPGGGVVISPATATTDASGRVTTTVTAGTVSGVVQVRAQAVDTPTLRSTPVQIVIHAGLPDADHFSVTREIRNVPGAVVYGVTNTVTAFVGDRYGNPVENGT
ncbi:MAG: Ig-like domain-containing protein, partial [Synechococcus sp.]|nr:Ig-like domain-containing protein [Synechococcus sp.]